jgi:tetratricopeptide (TPR) repeat protein
MILGHGRALLALAAGLLVASAGAPANGQPTSDGTPRSRVPQTVAEQAAAEALFREARALLRARKYAEACAKLAESQRIDPKLGTLLNLASCHEQQGKTATAWAEFSQAVGMALNAGQQARADYARSHAAGLERKLSRVVFRAPPAAATSEDLRIKVGDKELAAAAIGSRIPLDPGTYPVEVAAPDKKPWSTVISVPPGPATVEVDIPPLANAARPAAPQPPAPQAELEPDSAMEPPAEVGGWPPARIAGLVLGGVGLAGLGVGTYFGIRTLMKQGIVEDNCAGPYCNQVGLDADEDAHTSATISTIAFAAGAALLAGGVVLIFTSPGAEDAESAARPRLWVGLSAGDVRLGGAW